MNNSSVFLYKEYFPVVSGKFIDYQVMEITHDQNATVKSDTAIYQLRCLIGDTFTDNSGAIAYEYLRLSRLNESLDWTQKDLWSIKVENNKAQLVDENQRVVKMVFPISKYTTWNANQFNTDAKLTCSYKNIHQALNINSFNLDSTVLVEQENTRNLLLFKRKYEVYAKGLGLVRKYFKDLNINNFDTLNISSGKEIYMEMINFGG